MSAPPLVSDIQAAQLLTSDQLEELQQVASMTDDSQPQQLTDWMIEQGWITRWQAEELLAGRTEFFIGKYRLMEQLHASGLGTTYRAQQGKLGRQVVVKVMARHLIPTPAAVTQLHRKVHEVADVTHPFLASVFDADQSGKSYYVVNEWIDGLTIDDWVAQGHPLSFPAVVKVIKQLLAALDFAHGKNVLHGHVKASNVKVVVDDEGFPLFVKLLNLGFGRLSQELADAASEGQEDQTVNAPDYIAPERAEDSSCFTVQSDLYSVGCLFFKLLTSEVSFPGRNAMEKVLARVKRDAPLVSTLRNDTPKPLEAIVQKLLAREPENRYQTAKAVLKELQAWDQSSRSSHQALPQHQTPKPAAPEPEPKPQDDLSLELLEPPGKPESKPSAAPQPTIAPKPPEDDEEELRLMPTEEDQRKKSKLGGGSSQSSPGLTPKPARPIPAGGSGIGGGGSASGSGFSIGSVLDGGGSALDQGFPSGSGIGQNPAPQANKAPAAPTPAKPIPAAQGNASQAKTGQGGATPSSGSTQGSAIQGSAEVGEIRAFPKAKAQASGPVITVSFSPNSKFGLVATKQFATLWDLNSGEEVRRLQPHPEGTTVAVFSPLGRVAATGGQHGAIRLWDLQTGNTIREFTAHTAAILCLAFSHDGRSLISTSEDFSMRMWHVGTGEVKQWVEHQDLIRSVQFMADNQRILLAGGSQHAYDYALRVWNILSTQELAVMLGHQGEVHQVVLTANGRGAVSASADGTVRMWNVDGGRELAVLKGHTAAVLGAAVSPNNRRAISASADQTVRLWNLTKRTASHLFKGHQAPVRCVVMNSDASLALTGGDDGRARLWRLPTG